MQRAYALTEPLGGPVLNPTFPSVRQLDDRFEPRGAQNRAWFLQPYAGMEPSPIVLVVEDQDDASTPLCAILEVEGYRCHLADTGRKAVSLARKLRPVVILLDIDLPDISGIEAIEELRSEGALSSCCVVAVTGYTDAETQQRCRDAGVQAFFSKPIDPDALLRMVALAADAVEQTASPSTGHLHP